MERLANSRPAPEKKTRPLPERGERSQQEIIFQQFPGTILFQPRDTPISVPHLEIELQGPCESKGRAEPHRAADRGVGSAGDLKRRVGACLSAARASPAALQIAGPL